MELVRISGNDALHGEAIDFGSGPAVAIELMGLMNVLVDVLIDSRPMYQFMETLPPSVSGRAHYFDDDAADGAN